MNKIKMTQKRKKNNRIKKYSKQEQVSYQKALLINNTIKKTLTNIKAVNLNKKRKQI